MTLNNVKKLRELYGTDDLFIFTAECLFYDGKRKLSYIIWDDDNEIFHSIRPNQEFRCNDINDKPINIHSVNYESIVYMSDVMNIEDLNKFLKKLKSKGKIDDNKIDEIINNYKSELVY